MSTVIIRIGLRYLAMLLISKGIFSPELGNTIVADPDVLAAVQVGVGTAIAAATEAWYWAARKFGWAK